MKLANAWLIRITALKSLYWMFFITLAGVVCVLALGATMLKPNLTPIAAVQAEKPTYSQIFAEERLEIFSGWDFNLVPELNAFLNELEQGMHRPNEENNVPQLLQQYTQFVNPDFVSFEIYRTKLGDNFWKLAKNRGFTIDTIVGCNPQLKSITCYSRQEIILPSRGGSFHPVAGDETLDTIALDYAVELNDILNANRITPESGVITGMWLFIPGAKPRHLSETMYLQYCKRALFRSPLAGRYTSFVGMRIHPVLGFSKFHNGVDISCPINTWVGASAAGTVIAAGWGGAVGKYIKIDHHNGYQSVYGHLNAVYVHQGQTVKRGQLIGRSGATGRVTGPHLHYAIFKNGAVVNPMDYLW